MHRYSLILATQFSIRWRHLQASLSQERRSLHRQISEQAVLAQGFVSQQSTNGEVAEQRCCPFAPVALSG